MGATMSASQTPLCSQSRQRFESPADAVLIEALWTVTSKDGRQTGRALARQPIAAKDYSSLAAAHSAALAAISKDIAAAIKP